jgi:carbon-monoxide dehydrogenase large subunit
LTCGGGIAQGLSDKELESFMRPMKYGVGQPVRRVEDVRLVTGTGHFTDDHHPPGTVYAVVLRSPHAHARFRIGDLKAARSMPGVLLILTHADVTDLGTLQCLATVPNADGSDMATPPYPVLCADTVRHVGDAVAFVVAETENEARTAAEAVEIDWEPLETAIGIDGAEEDGAPLVWPEIPGNVAFDTEVGNREKTDEAFAKADRVISLTLVNNRLVTNYLEARACVAEYDENSTRWTLTLGSQGSHDMRDILARMLDVESRRIRVVAHDVGGGFGTKLFMYREYPLCAVAAERLKRPVKWVAARTEHFLGDAQGRDNITTAQIAVSPRGRFLGLRIDLKADLGAYLSQFGPFVPANGARMSPGCYDIPAVHARVRGYYTNTIPVDAYRGAGRPEAAYVIERLVDHVARELGKAPDAIRALNFIKPEQMPYTTPTDRTYDTSEFEGHMCRAMEVADWSDFKRRFNEAKKHNRIRGIGLASYIEACAGGSAESAQVRLGEDGTVTVLIGTQSSGQGHLTAYAQLVAQHLDLPPERIRVLQGDTDVVATGGGTGGSRSIPVGGASVAGASRRLAENLKQLAADVLEAGTADLEIADGQVRIAGTDRAVAFADLAASPKATPDLLTVSDRWEPPEATYPNGTHVCEVEIDPETGETEVVRYTIVDDFGVTLNPLLLAGQIHGGIAQGIGQALLERTIYDAGGQLVTASLMDYRLPRAADMPNFHFETRNVPSTTNVLGMKGAGEAGAIGACPAVMNAVADALHRGFGIREIDMPATPDRVFAAIQAARRRAAE